MLDRTIPPPFQTVGKIALKRAESSFTSNGVPIHVINAGIQPAIRIEFVFRSGKWYEQSNGTSFLTARLLTEGTRDRSAAEVAALFEQNGAFIETTPGLDLTTLTLFCLEHQVEKVVPLLTEIVSQPAFPQDELEIVRANQIQNLKINNEKSGFLANKNFRKLIFGNIHPYGRILEEKNLKSLKREDLVAHHSDLMSDFEVLVSGKVTDTVLAHLEKAVGQLNFNRNQAPAFPVLSQEPMEWLIEKEGEQSSIKLGKLSLPKDHRDFVKLLITNHVLGGYFGSRLMKNIREEKGLTYGIYSAVIPLLEASYFQVSADVKKELTTQALDETFKELQRMVEEPVPEEELEVVQQHLIGKFQAGINSPFSLADRFKSVHFYGMGYEYYADYLDGVLSCTPQVIQETASKYLAPESFSSVVVGMK